MRKAIVVLILVVLSLSFSVAMAADGLVYNDEELGFSFEMPADYEFYGDVSSETADITGTEKVTKQLLYTGYDSKIGIVYMEDSEWFDEMEVYLPNGMTRQEIDFYIFPDKKKDEITSIKTENAGNLESLHSELIDFGGKQCYYSIFKGNDPIYETDFFQGSLVFLYKDNIITIVFLKYDIGGTLEVSETDEEFKRVFNTLDFDVVPSDKDVILKSDAGVRIGAIFRFLLDIAIVVVVVVGIILFIRKRKKKYKPSIEKRD